MDGSAALHIDPRGHGRSRALPGPAGWPPRCLAAGLQGFVCKFFYKFFFKNTPAALLLGGQVPAARQRGGRVYSCKFSNRKYIFVKIENKKYKNKKTATL